MSSYSVTARANDPVAWAPVLKAARQAQLQGGMGPQVPQGSQGSPFGRALLSVLSGGITRDPAAAGKYYGDFLKGLDPRTPQGLVTLASTFFPGGRFGGRLTPMQKTFLESLGNVSGGGVPIHPRTGEPIDTWVRKQYIENPQKQFLTEAEVRGNPGLRSMAEALGYHGGGDTKLALLNSLKKPAAYGSWRSISGQTTEAASKAGLMPGTSQRGLGALSSENLVQGGSGGFSRPITPSSYITNVLRRNAIYRRN